MHRIIFIFISIAYLASCGSYDLVKPKHIDKSFTTHNIENIMIMPLLDARGYESKIDKVSGNPVFVRINLIGSDQSNSEYIKEKVPYSISTYLISERGYDVDYSENYGQINLTPNDLTKFDEMTIKKMNPDNSRYTMLLVLIDSGSGLATNISAPLQMFALGASSDAVVAAYLFDTHKGKVLWRHTVKGGGFLGTIVGVTAGLFMSDALQEQAIRDACYKLVRAFPKKGSKNIKFNDE